jgi:predicted kinase
MNENKSVLHFISGKLGSGKTTLAKSIANENHAIFISEDIWLEKLFPNMINNFQDYLLYSRRFRAMIAIHVIQLLNHGVSVIFDFAGNVSQERQWVKSIIDQAQSSHILHYIVASDDLCRSQFKMRNLNLPEGSKIVTDEEFDAVNKYFMAPTKDEGFNIKFHYRSAE